MNRILTVILFSFLFQLPIATEIIAQEPALYDTDLLTKDFHRCRREALRSLLPDSSVAVFFASPVRNRSNDINYEYHQNPDFYYLTGLNEPNSMLLLFKEEQEFDSIRTNEIVFVQGRDTLMERWIGKRLTPDEAKQKNGFDYVFLSRDFADFKVDFKRYKRVYHPKFYEDIRDDNADRGDLYSIIRQFKSKVNYSANTTVGFDLEQMMARLREVKTEQEISLIKKAIAITCEAQLELMKALEPEMTEYQVQSIIEYHFKKNGAEYVAYPSIVGGGDNSCIAHYTSNRKLLQNKDMLVVDVGAEYHGYAADITRTFPVDGKFSEQEKTIYNIVLEAQAAGIKACKKGNDFRAPHNAAVAIVQKRLLEQGIIKASKDFNKYFFHGTSHHLGLDVHDASLFGKLMPGNVITVEPGIYIPAGSDCDPKWWNIGVRIEDDVLITETGYEVLSGNLPKKIEEIELIMQESSPFSKTKK